MLIGAQTACRFSAPSGPPAATLAQRLIMPREQRHAAAVCRRVANRQRQADQIEAEAPSRTPSARTIARLMTSGRNAPTEAETVVVAAIKGGILTLVDIRKIVADFREMIRHKSLCDFEPWLDRAKGRQVVICQRHCQGSRRCRDRHHVALVQ